MASGHLPGMQCEPHFAVIFGHSSDFLESRRDMHVRQGHARNHDVEGSVTQRQPLCLCTHEMMKWRNSLRMAHGRLVDIYPASKHLPFQLTSTQALSNPAADIENAGKWSGSVGFTVRGSLAETAISSSFRWWQSMDLI